MIKLKNIYQIISAARPHIKRGSWAATEALVAPILLIALSPWLLKELGLTGLGQWALALSLSGFAHVVSLGSGVSTMFAVSAAAAKNMQDEVLAAIKAGLFITLITAIILTTLSWLTADYVAFTFFSKMGGSSTVASVLMLGVWALSLQQIDDVFTGALRGIQRYDLVAALELIARPIWALCIAYSAHEYKSILVVLAVHCSINLVKTIIRAGIVVNVFKINSFSIRVPIKELLIILNFGKWISLQGIGGVLFATMDKVLVGWLFGSSEIARYSICIQVAQFIHNLQASGLQIITPWVIRKNIGLSSSEVSTNLFKISLWSGIVCMALPLTLLVFSWYILKLWMGEVFAVDNVDLLRVLLAGAAMLAFTIPTYYIILGLGRAKFSAILLFAAGLASIMCSVALTPFGLVAFAGGRLVYGVVACLYLLPLFQISYQARQ